jgi:hypothetical protein
MRPRPSFWVMIVGATLALLGAFLPWATASAVFVSVSKNGIDGDGKLTAVLAVVTGILVLTYLRSASRQAAVLVIVGVLGAIVALVGVADFVDVSSKIGDLTTEEQRLVSISVGIGLYLTIAAGVAIVVGGIMGRFER